MREQHVLVDCENVHPTIEELLKLAPDLTDVWLFHGPNQIKRAEQLQAAHERVTLVPHSGKGKNALDFHLSFYLGYVAAKHPEASLMVVANDKGYDSMIEHAKLLGFTATRVGFEAKDAPAAKKAAPAKKVATKKAAPAKPAASVDSVTVAPAKKAVAKQAPAKRAPVKKVPAKKTPKSPAPAKVTPAAKKVTTKKAPAQKAAAKKVPTAKVAAKQSAASPAGTALAASKAAPARDDKVLARAKASLTKMGKNRPTKFASLLRHLKSIVGQGATADDADALSHRLEAVKFIQVVGDLVLYP